MIRHDPDAIRETIERYLRRELSEQEERAWEEHYFSCDECFESMRETAEIHDFLRAAPVERRRDEPRSLARWVSEAVTGRLPWSPAFATAAALIVVSSGLAIRGLVLERRHEEEITTLRGPQRIVAQYLVEQRRGPGLEGPPRFPRPEGPVALQFHLLEPPPGADSFRVTLFGPRGDVLWTDVVPARGAVTSLSVMLREGDLVAGEHRLAVEEVRRSDLVRFGAFEIPFVISLTGSVANTPE